MLPAILPFLLEEEELAAVVARRSKFDWTGEFELLVPFSHIKKVIK